MSDQRQQWLDARTAGIGGSDAPVILGLSPWKSRLTLWAEKAGLVEPADLSDNEAVEWGVTLEPVIAEKYAKVTGRILEDPGRFNVIHSAEWPFMLGSVDRRILPLNVEGPGILEIKTAGAAKSDEWTDGPPRHYYAQLQHYLVVTGCRWGAFAVLIGGQKFRHFDVQRDDSFCLTLIEEERKFWQSIRDNEPPAPDETLSSRDTLHRLYPEEETESIALDGSTIDLDENLETIKARMKALEADKMRIENLIKASIGTAALGVLPNGVSYSWKLQKKAAYTVPASETRMLRRIKAKG